MRRRRWKEDSLEPRFKKKPPSGRVGATNPLDKAAQVQPRPRRGAQAGIWSLLAVVTVIPIKCGLQSCFARKQVLMLVRGPLVLGPLPAGVRGGETVALSTSKGSGRLAGEEGRPRRSAPSPSKLLPECLTLPISGSYQLKNNDRGDRAASPPQ